MRVAELSRRTGVSVASIKYYLREGLLHPGERTSPNQAAYGDDHVRRLRLVRALIDVGGLSVAASREVLEAVDDEEVGMHRALGVVQHAVTSVPAAAEEDEATGRARTLVDDLVARRGWRVHPDNPGRHAAVGILATCERLDGLDLAGGLDAYAEAMEGLAEHEVASILGGGRENTAENAAIGMVLGASLVTAVRTMAQEAASARRWRPAGEQCHDPVD